MGDGCAVGFNCPHCQAHYKVVRVPGPSGAADTPVFCRTCQQPLTSADGDDILKYFLLDRPGRSR
jgi:hypothetical protein